MNVKKENKSEGRVLLVQEKERLPLTLAWSLTVLQELNGQIKKSSKDWASKS